MQSNISKRPHLINDKNLVSLLSFVLMLFIAWQVATVTLITANAQSDEANLDLDQEHLERANRAFIYLVNKAKPAVVHRSQPAG